MRVLLTGATGYIADQLLPAFRERYDLRLLDVREEDGSGRRVEGIEVADLLVDDRSKLEPYLRTLRSWSTPVTASCRHGSRIPVRRGA